MKFGLLTLLFAAICSCYADGGKTKALLAALNGQLLLNGAQRNGANPVMMAGGLNPPMVAGGGAGFIGQPQFVQFVPAFVAPNPIPNIYPPPAVSAVPFMGIPQMPQMNLPQQGVPQMPPMNLPQQGVPQMLPMNLPQQPMMGFPGGVVPQQPSTQPNVLRRFRRQNEKPKRVSEENVDTQIPVPTESTKTTTAPCDEHREHN